MFLFGGEFGGVGILAGDETARRVVALGEAARVGVDAVLEVLEFVLQDLHTAGPSILNVFVNDGCNFPSRLGATIIATSF